MPSPAPLTPTALQGNSAFPTSVALLLLRLALGYTFIFHGFQLIHDGPEKFAEHLNMPVLPPIVWAYLASYGQLIGGITIFFGILTRLGTIPLIINMFVAIATVHAPHGFSLQNGGYEYNINLIAMAAVLLIAGPGLISLDALLFKRSLWSRGPQPLSNPITRV